MRRPVKAFFTKSSYCVLAVEAAEPMIVKEKAAFSET